ncbi:hypothetical protein FB157_104174 [Streptomyces sp. BK340]|nr:hypothetical protein FB157_104174 [Streptomyces sp. BK340]
MTPPSPARGIDARQSSRFIRLRGDMAPQDVATFGEGAVPAAG